MPRVTGREAPRPRAITVPSPKPANASPARAPVLDFYGKPVVRGEPYYWATPAKPSPAYTAIMSLFGRPVVPGAPQFVDSAAFARNYGSPEGKVECLTLEMMTLPTDSDDLVRVKLKGLLDNIPRGENYGSHLMYAMSSAFSRKDLNHLKKLVHAYAKERGLTKGAGAKLWPRPTLDRQPTRLDRDIKDGIRPPQGPAPWR